MFISCFSALPAIDNRELPGLIPNPEVKPVIAFLSTGVREALGKGRAGSASLYHLIVIFHWSCEYIYLFEYHFNHTGEVYNRACY